MKITDKMIDTNLRVMLGRGIGECSLVEYGKMKKVLTDAREQMIAAALEENISAGQLLYESLDETYEWKGLDVARRELFEQAATMVQTAPETLGELAFVTTHPWHPGFLELEVHSQLKWCSAANIVRKRFRELGI